MNNSDNVIEIVVAGIKEEPKKDGSGTYFKLTDNADTRYGIFRVPDIKLCRDELALGMTIKGAHTQKGFWHNLSDIKIVDRAIKPVKSSKNTASKGSYDEGAAIGNALTNITELLKCDSLWEDDKYRETIFQNHLKYLLNRSGTIDFIADEAETPTQTPQKEKSLVTGQSEKPQSDFMTWDEEKQKAELMKLASAIAEGDDEILGQYIIKIQRSYDSEDREAETNSLYAKMKKMVILKDM